MTFVRNRREYAMYRRHGHDIAHARVAIYDMNLTSGTEAVAASVHVYICTTSIFEKNSLYAYTCLYTSS
jgi:hypothetical protein